MSWYAKSIPDVLKELGADEHGLTSEVALARLKEFGANELPREEGEGIVILFLRQFASPLIYILLVAAIGIFLLGESTDSVIILIVLVINAIVGTYQEGKAANTLRALDTFSETMATVMRDGTEIIISDREVVPGDVLILNEGEKVPADARLIDARTLKVNEASMTGESEPVGKTSEVIAQQHLRVTDQLNVVFKGTNIVSGNGRAVVFATGLNTVIGNIARVITTIESDIPLRANIRALSRAIIVVVAIICTSLLGLGLMLGHPFVTIFSTVVSLAVSIIPEGLPVVITLVLATGVWRMGKRNALVKRLQAVEALGQARIIAVDKTGTLTKNELMVNEVFVEGNTYHIGGVGYEPTGTVELNGIAVVPANHEALLFAGKVSALLSNARVSYASDEKKWRVSGDPTEAALLVFGEKMGFRKDDLLGESPLISEMPFDYRVKYHATIHKVSGASLLSVVGAPEEVLALCTSVHSVNAKRILDADERAHLLKVYEEMSARGLRVVAYAVREESRQMQNSERIHSLSFGGLFGIEDVLRADIFETVKRAEDAGIKVVMITGDHKLTARAIAEQAGIWHSGDALLTGDEMDTLSDIELSRRLSDVSVFARVTPEHKLRIIHAYKQRGEIVAMTGDGVNDAPSLMAADLGVAMGVIGTEVAKEASDIVLLDDNFGSIISAVEEGRSIYITIKKVVTYLFSTSIGEASVILGALLLGLELPLLAVQIIWLNLVTDGFLTVAMGMEPKEEGLLSRHFEKPKKYLIDHLMLVRMILMALPMMLGTLYLFSIYSTVDITKAWTMSLTVLAVAQWFNAWNCRSESESVFKMNPFSNMYLVWATIVVAVLQVIALYTPFMQTVLHTTALSLSEWALVVVVASSIIVVEEVRKFFSRMATPVRVVQSGI